MRNTRRNRMFGVVAGGVALIWGTCGVALASIPLWSEEPSAALLAPMFLAPAYAGFRWARRAWSAEVVVSAEEVVVRGPWRTQHYPLGNVAGFTAGLQPAPGELNPMPGVLLKLTDGSRVPIWTLASEGFVWNNDRNARKWVSTAEALNTALQAQRS